MERISTSGGGKYNLIIRTQNTSSHFSRTLLGITYRRGNGLSLQGSRNHIHPDEESSQFRTVDSRTNSSSEQLVYFQSITNSLPISLRQAVEEGGNYRAVLIELHFGRDVYIPIYYKHVYSVRRKLKSCYTLLLIQFDLVLIYHAQMILFDCGNGKLQTVSPYSL
jgi:hypothetical protein